VFHTDEWDIRSSGSYVFPSKWFAADGKTLWLLFSGRREGDVQYDAFCVRKATLIPAANR
jgi:hypothetical protein